MERRQFLRGLVAVVVVPLLAKIVPASVCGNSRVLRFSSGHTLDSLRQNLSLGPLGISAEKLKEAYDAAVWASVSQEAKPAPPTNETCA